MFEFGFGVGCNTMGLLFDDEEGALEGYSDGIEVGLSEGTDDGDELGNEVGNKILAGNALGC